MEYDLEMGCYRKIIVDDDKENILVEIRIERVEYCFCFCLDENVKEILEKKDIFFNFDKVLEDIIVLMELVKFFSIE